jgi:hypothetical protein
MRLQKEVAFFLLPTKSKTMEFAKPMQAKIKIKFAVQ